MLLTASAACLEHVGSLRVDNGRGMVLALDSKPNVAQGGLLATPTHNWSFLKFIPLLYAWLVLFEILGLPVRIFGPF